MVGEGGRLMRLWGFLFLHGDEGRPPRQWPSESQRSVTPLPFDLFPEFKSRQC